MTETAVEPGERGSLEIKHKAVERLAVLAARGTESVTDRNPGLRVLGGRDLPKADVTINGTRVRAQVAVAVTWPSPLAKVAANVRAAVARDLSELGIYTVDRVDVTVQCVPAEATVEEGRVQ
ncbi:MULTISPECIES: Asp23/Gls24 family envelope stress response protein [Rhodococcus]|uniref:Asp23/Gls24 family envelope stress response protein n=1 Tax=Rhodococcoides yunnanense TaxID=278209 RepID=A0ABU4B8G5_9NOCA|nr:MULTISPECIES: Asp23/Gls24 family envelope stress response protein [Rhodococcus]MDI9893799.1 Asp23/Gls24 family envelope stress response protein [Rhodococcus sp. IEGM 1381]MDV6260473.1 Asp23/Gls24 family envelope stress response protein [Rhodococcus yunnanensis]QIH99078.1 Asp23/Gls24 family envelope stress response protein [Rhodococcus fascians A21d2]